MSLRDQIPRYLLDRRQISSTLVYTALFSLVFLLLSTPFLGHVWFSLDPGESFFFTVAFVVLAAALVAFSRLLMGRCRTLENFTYLGYIAWVVVEVVAVSLLYTFFTIEGGRLGAAHAYELPFVFHTTEVSQQYLGEETDEIRTLADKMSAAWVSFAKTGKPVVEGFDWKPYSSQDGGTMYFGPECSVRQGYDRELVSLMQNR